MSLKWLDDKHYLYGNKGCVWSKKAHIAESGFNNPGTLCGTPMLATNWVALEGIQEPGCPECIEIYNKKLNQFKK
jgi:hypothetical protein